MNNRYSLFSLFFSLLISVSLSAEGIEFFHGTWQEALEHAQEEGKIVFVDAYTTWCGPCKRMSKNVFTQNEVGSFFNENFVSIKVDMEKKNGREFGAKYPVSAYPTLFFLEPNGKIIQKTVGGKQVAQLVELGQDIVSKFDYSAAEREAYENGDRSYETVLAYIQGMNKSGKSSLKVANDYLLSEHGMTDVQMSTFLFEATTEVDSKIYEKMISRKSEVIGVVGQEAFQKKIKSAATRTMNKAIEYEDEKLMKEACSAVKKHHKSASKSFDINAKMKVAVNKKDSKSYIKQSKSHLKTLESVDDKVAFAQKAMEHFPKDKKLYEFLDSFLKPALEEPKDKEHVGIYVKLLLEMDKNKEALAYAKNAVKQFEDSKSKSYLNNLIKYIEKYKAS